MDNSKVNYLTTAPNNLGKNKVAKDFYQAFIEASVVAGTFEEQDTLAIVLITQQYEIYASCLKELRVKGGKLAVVEVRKDNNRNDKKIPNILLPTMNAAYKELLLGLKEFGLTPKSRKGMSKQDNNDNSDALDKLIALMSVQYDTGVTDEK